MSALWLEVFKAGLTLSIALVTVFGGLFIYFRQKEFEIVKQRYLEGTLDVVAADLEALLAESRHNWTRALALLKEHRDGGTKFDRHQIGKEFKFANSEFLNRVAHLRLGRLLGDNVAWTVYQLAYAYSANTTNEISNDLAPALCIERPDEADRKAWSSRAVEHLIRMDAESQKFAHLALFYRKLIVTFEKLRFKFGTIDEFKDEPDVRAAIDELKMVFMDDLARIEVAKEAAKK